MLHSYQSISVMQLLNGLVHQVLVFGIMVRFYLNLGLFVFVLLTPIMWVRKLQKFAYLHLFGDIMVVLVTVTVVGFSLYYIFDENKGKIQPNFEVFNSSRFSLFFGTRFINS